MRIGLGFVIGAGTVVALSVALAGCSAEFDVGGGSQASGEEIAEEISGAYDDQTGIALTRLSCEDVDEDAAERFECSGRNARGVQIEVSGKVTDIGGDGFDYSWRVSKAIAPGVLYERALRQQIEVQGVALSEVRCPLEIEVEVDAEVRCVAADSGGVRRGVTLNLTDLEGGFEFRVDGESGAEDLSS